jgi:transposase
MARGDLSDQAWHKIQPLLPPERNGKRGRPYKDHRSVINGILWIARTGAPWRDLPERYGSCKTCHDRLAKWQKDGTWHKVLQALQGHTDACGEVLWDDCAIDSTSVKAHPHAAGARRAQAKKGALARPRPPVEQARRGWAAAGVV